MRAIFKIDKNALVDKLRLTRCTKSNILCRWFVNSKLRLTIWLTWQLTPKTPINKGFIINCQLST